MFLFENDKCPVCDKEFEEGEDIVVCPECGTPHHRECYNITESCANKKLHKTDFKFERSAEQAQQEEALAEEEKPAQQPLLASLIDNNKTEEVKQLISENISDNDESEQQEIDGVSVYDVSQVIGINIKYYLPRFLKNKKLNWNWGAFFFGQLYYFFRKMYVQGLIFTTINFAINLVVEKFFSKPLLAYVNAAEAKLAEYSTYFGNYINGMSADYKNIFDSLIISCFISLILSVVMAICANRLYKRKVINTVKTVDEKMKNGETFAVNPLMMSQEVDLSQEDMRKLFLSKQGGVSWLAPALVYLAVMLLTQI